MNKNIYHVPVLFKEILDYFNPKSNQNYIDATLGDGGHTEMLLEKTSPNGKVMAFDLDQEAINRASKRLEKYKDRIIFVNKNFKEIKKVVNESKFSQVSGILFDLGLSTYQLQSSRGFSFQTQGKLDMKFDEATRKHRSAFQIINEGKEEELRYIFRNYGEIQNYWKLTEAIVNKRTLGKIKTSQELVETVRHLAPERFRSRYLAQVFQAIRIAVNNELENIKDALKDSVNVIETKGKIAVISYHSLEDRIVKQFFQQESKGCLCPSEIPICQCHHQASLKILTKKPIIPTDQEIKNNSKSRSAKLRIAEKI
ncbi:MAG: 16S rRNA (cytosine(1402)-N(4))-methyltransferase RsmH [Patescibacteria group bacterium]|nr:16S rRNA (cytosine(1402)-N(4))-methyltransferase RsmH [Patescibacteria group bacterium]